jgi:hypothetical protein
MFEPGEELLVIDGPFTDFKGVVEEVQYEKSRLTLTINVFNRPTQVELEFRQVEKSFNLNWLKNARFDKSGIVVVTVSLLRNWGAFIGVCTQR